MVGRHLHTLGTRHVPVVERVGDRRVDDLVALRADDAHDIVQAVRLLRNLGQVLGARHGADLLGAERQRETLLTIERILANARDVLGAVALPARGDVDRIAVGQAGAEGPVEGPLRQAAVEPLRQDADALGQATRLELSQLDQRVGASRRIHQDQPSAVLDGREGAQAHHGPVGRREYGDWAVTLDQVREGRNHVVFDLAARGVRPDKVHRDHPLEAVERPAIAERTVLTGRTRPVTTTADPAGDAHQHRPADEVDRVVELDDRRHLDHHFQLLKDRQKPCSDKCRIFILYHTFQTLAIAIRYD